MPKFQRKIEKGFTLLETILAIFVLLIMVIGVYFLFARLILLSSFPVFKLTAAYLAQEGIEIVRNIRDSNWLKGEPFNRGIPQGEWEADYQTQELQDDYDGDFLRLNPEGFYNYLIGKPTKFQRKISILYNGTSSLDVIVTVYWKERGKDFSFTAKARLFNWFGKL